MTIQKHKNLTAIQWIGDEGGYLKLLDQTLLPGKLKFITCKSVQCVWHSIKEMKIRGAPAIGICASFGIYLAIRNSPTKNSFFKQLHFSTNYLLKSRPTAINLRWAVDNVLKNIPKTENVSALKSSVFKTAIEIFNFEKQVSEKMGEFGASLLKDGFSVLTHCNTGFLATSGIGTALAAIYKAYQQGKRIKVYVDETRPLLQGSRLTVWELLNHNIDVTLICDNTAGFLMSKKKIDAVLVGADRIAANGDFANKIGTFSLAALAKLHNIPFYVVAPSSSFDLSIENGSQIPIEERSPDEVRKINSCNIAPRNVNVFNPAFDVTPHKYISSIVTEKGIIRKVTKPEIKKVIKG